MPMLSQTAGRYFIFQMTSGQAGQFLGPNPMNAGASPTSQYNNFSESSCYAWQHPLAYGPNYDSSPDKTTFGITNWDSSEFPTADLVPLQAQIYASADHYSRSYCSTPLDNATDQQKVASIMAALRDVLLGNFICPNLSPNGRQQDFAIASEVSEFVLGRYKMLAIIANAVNNTNKAGFKIQCTEVAPILTFILCGYGICAREWQICFLDKDENGNTSVLIDTDTVRVDSLPQHGTVEYFDTQLGKWVLVDLLYGIAGIVDPNVQSSQINVGGIAGVPLSLPEFVSVLATGESLPVIWTGRNTIECKGSWFTALSGQGSYLATDSTPEQNPYDPNGNKQMKEVFLSSSSDYSQYLTHWAPPSS